MIKRILFYFGFQVFCCVFLAGHSFSQSKGAMHSNSEYAKTPYWIQMMADTNANYFETLKSFELYWVKRPEPIEEEEVIGEPKNKKEERKTFFERFIQSKKERYEAESRKYAFEYKKFINWKRTSLPYVQPDGRILAPSERLKIWQDMRRD